MSDLNHLSQCPFWGVIFLLCKGKKERFCKCLVCIFCLCLQEMRQLFDWWVFSVWQKVLGLTKETPHFHSCIIIPRGCSTLHSSFPTHHYPLLLHSLIHRTLPMNELQKRVRHTLCLDEGSMSSTFPWVQPHPFVLGHDRKSVFILNWKAPAWVRPDGCWPQAMEKGMPNCSHYIGAVNSLEYSLEKLFDVSPWTWTLCWLCGEV